MDPPQPPPPPPPPPASTSHLPPHARITVCLTTSPIQSHPSTEILEQVLSSFRLAPGLETADRVVVFDGWRPLVAGLADQPKSGKISEETGRGYREYCERAGCLLIADLPAVEEGGEGEEEGGEAVEQEKAGAVLGGGKAEAGDETATEAAPSSPTFSTCPPSSSTTPLWRSRLPPGYTLTETHQAFKTGAQSSCTVRLITIATRFRTPLRMLFMSDRVGFALAVRSSLDHVGTPYVMVVQHDWRFSRPVDLGAILNAMERDRDEIKYVGFVSRRIVGYADRKGRRQFLPPSKVEEGRYDIPLTRLFFWFDKNHIAETDHYRNFVFSQGRFQRGDFIEDTFGQSQLTDIKRRTQAEGLAAHARYGTFLYYPADGQLSHITHLNGRKYLTEEGRKGLFGMGKRMKGKGRAREPWKRVGGSEAGSEVGSEFGSGRGSSVGGEEDRSESGDEAEGLYGFEGGGEEQD
ncbi:hypothetical protein BDK51DRAFT_39459 [Blyttiomyces helicus]|uniref:Uncharacterized protein n=1 Tax=Blyttiomyces helicus TaxID=388810 RepID=A0A4P9WGI1_9FUNG|nr:hypothetical protein BDK51DRAFT_39459 [Blyttiomyces helicus]|eukprot:RKO90140.1 hypothetical protein BDK51DRAFT_39459 [Blyttiomyces helicus]